MERTVYQQFTAILSWHLRKIACGCWKLTTPGCGPNEILRMSFSNAFCQKETCAFWLEFHSNLFLWAQLASSQHLFILWFSSDQRRAIYWSNDHPFQWRKYAKYRCCKEPYIRTKLRSITIWSLNDHHLPQAAGYTVHEPIFFLFWWIIHSQGQNKYPSSHKRA